ncbi:coiled-coil domain-containing protein 172 isoform X2 [Electrophorus electricus]|uniref:coiled-coil domain-containing protein 172 isoform X2 n=1 Tax=Electrophorus electricus TaxID=8005 RepID=UPI0015CFEF5F|nr:coiled-coil domain-containing protein 172 isoform X2 [Electrophorus electricus]
MSLDSLFQHILLTEQHVSENTRQLQEAKAAILTAQEEIKSFTEKLDLAHVKHDEKAQLLSEATMDLHLTKKQYEQLEKTRGELEIEQSACTQKLERLRRESVEEKAKFMKEIMTFNNDFNLLSNRDLVFQSRTRSEIQSLQLEADTLNEVVEVMRQKNPQLVSKKSEQGSLETALQELKLQVTELERELEEALALAESLKTERLVVSQKPLTDSTCLRCGLD